MTDELDALKAALRAAPPPPDPAARARARAQAMENFDRLQGSAAPARSSDVPPRKAGILAGVRDMLKTLSTRPALAATTSAAALLAGFLVILPLAGRPPLTETAPPETAAPEAPVATLAAPEADAPAVAAAEAPIAAPGEAPGEAPVVAEEAPPQTARKARAKSASGGAPADALADLAGEATALPEAKPAPAPMVAPGLLAEAPPAPLPDTEAYANAAENPVHVTAEEPVSTFSIDVDTASYAVVRSSLMAGVLPDPQAVRVEEMVNYFPYAYPAPTDDAPFRPTVTVMPTPWNPGTQLVQIGLQGALPEIAARPALNLVFLIDTSGSMEDANKLPLLKRSLALMLPQLRPGDQVAIVAYAGSAGLVLPATAAGDRAAILGALDRLAAGGATAGAEGITLAYDVARGMAAPGEVSRVLLATDGDFNVGIDDPQALTRFIEGQRKDGIYLSVLGFGRGNLDDATMQALAQNGNGQAAYIDTLAEAQKVLVDQLTGALYPIADNVKVQVEWNPAMVAEYRLIGYETRALRREDFNNDRVDAGDIGAGTQVTALYEVTPPGSPALLNDPLRYGAAAPAGGTGELGFLRLRAVLPGQSDSRLTELPIRPGAAEAGDEARFAAAIAGFGQKLRGSTYLGDWGWAEMIALAEGAKGADPYGYRAEAVTLMRLAESLSAR